MRGFSLLESLVALMILCLVLSSFLGSLTQFQDVARVQGDVAEASEDLRYSVASLMKFVRMAGAGGLAIVAPHSGAGVRPLAIDVVDNFSSGQGFRSSAGGGTWDFHAGRSPVEGTDVLRIRGVMTTPMYGISAGDFDRRGRCSISSVSPWTGTSQKLSVPGVTRGRPFLFSLQMPMGRAASSGRTRDRPQWRVVEIVEEAVVENLGAGRRMNLEFNDGGSGAYVSLNGVSDPEVRMGAVFAGGFLDDLVFMVSENGYGGSSLYRLRPSRGPGGRILAEEMVANVVDLQLALGCDLDGDWQIGDNEWFLSRGTNDGPTGNQMATLRQVRLTVVTRTQRPDQRWTDGSGSHENGLPISPGQLAFRYRAMTVRVTPRIIDCGSGDPVGRR